MTSIRTLKYIGAYLEDRFRTESYWPPGSNNLYPIRTLEELVWFVTSRQGENRKVRLRAWLVRILQNARGKQCVGNAKWVENELRQYHVRDVNELGWNATMNYLRSVIAEGSAIRREIPVKKRVRRASAYPHRCRL